MQRINSYDFYIEARRIGNPASHYEKVEDDTLALVVDDTLFSALCAGRLSAGYPPGKAVIEPVWESAGVTPCVVGLNVTIFWNGDDGEVSYTRRYDKSPFRPRAKQIIAALLKEELKAATEDHPDEGIEDQRFLWMVVALEKPAPPPPQPGRKFSARTVDSSFPVQPRSFEKFNLRWPESSAEPFAVYVSSGVVREIQERTIETEGRAEQAGVLIGHLAQDIESARIFAVVTAHLEATVSIEAEMDSFKFTAETFIEIHRRIQLRHSGEIVLGWQHSHHYCPGCPSNPSGTTIFFSSADIAVQSAAFRSPYMVALVAGRDLELEPRRPAVRMFGWSSADIKPRHFVQYEIESEDFENAEARSRTVGPAV